jgi:hypothetical protein
VYATNKTGSSSDDWIYYQMVTHALINYTYTQAIQCCLSFTPVKVYRCTHTRILLFPLVVSQQRISTHNYNNLTLQVSHINLLITEQSSYLTPITHCELNWPTCTLLLLYLYFTGRLTTNNWRCTAFSLSYQRWNLIRGERNVVYGCA